MPGLADPRLSRKAALLLADDRVQSLPADRLYAAREKVARAVEEGKRLPSIEKLVRA